MTFADRRVVITGGAGFIGTNVARRVLADGGQVVILDDLSRAGVTENLRRLRANAPTDGLRIEIGDVRQAPVVRRMLRGADTVFHFAAQVAVTTSITDPKHDFSVNLGGTLTLLEAIRHMPDPPALLFTSTNKVYGKLLDVPIVRRGARYQPSAASVRRHGIGEARSLEFCSPYGCSKGGADQYILDYADTYGLPAVVFRMSCIYGPHQCGNEDQGWLAHFLLQALADREISIFGDGMQVRDALFVDDLVDAMDAALTRIELTSGRAFNIGGGPANTVSLLELLTLIESLGNCAPRVTFHDWRTGDQRWYVSDTRAFTKLTRWSPKVGVAAGVERLRDWLLEHRVVEAMEAAM
jgi:CDP-paratose 2-epimerase